MSGYQTQTLPNFFVLSPSQLQPQVQANPQIIYANFGVYTGAHVGYEARVNPMNLGNAGYFDEFSSVGPTMSFYFKCVSPVKRAVALMSLAYPYSIKQESPGVIRFDMSSLPSTFEGTLSIMVSNFDGSS